MFVMIQDCGHEQVEQCRIATEAWSSLHEVTACCDLCLCCGLQEVLSMDINANQLPKQAFEELVDACGLAASSRAKARPFLFQSVSHTVHTPLRISPTPKCGNGIVHGIQRMHMHALKDVSNITKQGG